MGSAAVPTLQVGNTLRGLNLKSDETPPQRTLVASLSITERPDNSCMKLALPSVIVAPAQGGRDAAFARGEIRQAGFVAAREGDDPQVL